MEFIKQKTQTLYQTEYLDFKSTSFGFRHKQKDMIGYGNWSYIERVKKTQAVVIIPLIRSTREIILIRQFRIPFWKFLIEFPAGLVEIGEDISETALRELKEETGFSGKIVFKSPPLAVSAGLTTELITYCFIEVDVDSLTQQSLDPIEDIEIFRVKINDFSFFLQKQMELDDIIDCKVFLSANILMSVFREA